MAGPDGYYYGLSHFSNTSQTFLWSRVIGEVHVWLAT